ncbi:MAG TPA: 6-carboxytetrahydropterin synthase QueD [Thermodesulfobacteriota bacterium]|nr:6-carboxytetrahydropterin synthase QueD [Thermodesulfobacteriota bacterium]
MYELTVEATFSAAHNLRGYLGACENLHGHNWKVEVRVVSETLDGVGMVIDFRKLKAETNRIIEGLDHRYLNEVPPFDRENATAENISRHIYLKLKESLGPGVRVSRVTVWESENAAAAYYE